MIRRFAAIFLLGVTVSAQAAPIAASVRSCAMPHTGMAQSCARCDAVPGGAQETSFSAGTCCRFEATEPVARAVGVVPSSSRSVEAATAVAMLSSSPQFDPMAPSASGLSLFTPRSTDSPLSLHTTLRL